MRAKEELDDLRERRLEEEARMEDGSDEEGEINGHFDEGATRGCFDPHVRWMAQVRDLYPFIEINRPGPRTNLSIPILQRPYHPYNDQGTFWNIQRVDRTLLVDLRTLTIPSHNDVPSAAQTSIFSILAPADRREQLVFPGVIWPNCFGPQAINSNSATTLGDRLNQIITSRSKISTFLEQVRATLINTNSEEIESPTITLYLVRGLRLVPFRVNRASFFRVVHPCFNPLVTEDEATYLRGACYLLHEHNADEMALSVDRLLRTPQMDEFLCRELLASGCLDSLGMGDTTIKVLEKYEKLARGNED